MVSNIQSKIHPLSEHIEFKIKRNVWSFFWVAFLHILVLLLFRHYINSEMLKFSTANERLPMKLEIIPTHYAEVNPEAAENQPDKSQFYSFKDQQAADKSLNENNSSVPLLDGSEVSSLKIVSDEVVMQESELLPGVYQLSPNQNTSPAQNTSASSKAGQAESVTEAVTISTNQAEIASTSQINPFEKSQNAEGVDVIAFKNKEALILNEKEQRKIIPMTKDALSLIPQDVTEGEKNRPAPMARPKLSSEITSGPLMQSSTSANEIGVIALDASFSEFGEYEQQFYSALQVGWYNEVAFYKPMDSGTQVNVSFILKSDGSIDSIKILSSTAGLIATTICESAIVKRSPFRPWTQDMIQVFGEQKELRVRFYYR